MNNIIFSYREDDTYTDDVGEQGAHSEYQNGTATSDTAIVNDVSLDVERGSFVAILGRNGSGKSTLAKLMNGLLLPDGGNVLVNGYDTKDPGNMWKVRETVGMVFQNPDNQIVASVVEDDVAFGPENLAIEPDVIREIVTGSLRSVGMLDMKERAPHMLSGGQKQRVAIAGVIAMDPECIVLDEPTSMLDPRGRMDVMEIIKALHNRGITVILVTHYMEEAVAADRIIIMEDGRIAVDGTPEEIFADHEVTGKVKALGLEIPPAARMAEALRRQEIDVPANVISAEELVEYICRYR